MWEELKGYFMIVNSVCSTLGKNLTLSLSCDASSMAGSVIYGQI